MQQYNSTVIPNGSKGSAGNLTKTAFVSTNSISQGEQVGILWNELFSKYHIKIHFAHRTFKWSNEAKGNAGVHVVIIGFANFDINTKKLYNYNSLNIKATEIDTKNINPYLVSGKDIFIDNRKSPINNVALMNYGSMPIDSGNLILSDEERNVVINTEPITKKLIKQYTGGDEFINNKKRWCIWLVDITPADIKKSKTILNRIKQNKEYRESSNRKTTKKLSMTPSLFGEIRQPKTQYILIPKVSSENRKYIPIGIINPNIIASGSCLIVPDASLFIFGVLTSQMHMIWTANVCGRLESRFQYSASIVYNNYPWPENPTEKQKAAVEAAAQGVLDARAQYPDASLADLYDPNTMPPPLVKAHQKLDKAVDLCYRPQPFPDEARRIEYLFELYDKYTAGLFKKEKKKRKRK